MNEKSMKYNFEKLSARVLDALEKTDLEKIKYILERIEGPTISTGVGGSKVVSDYASQVLNKKNSLVAISHEPRDMNYLNLKGYKNIMACSYSGNNYGVERSFANDLEKYLLSNNPSEKENVHNLTYETSLPKERSFISLGATLIPMSILLSYYIDNDISIIEEILKCQEDITVDVKQVYEIFSGIDTKAASTYLESTLTEAGLATPIVHDKYSFCHGRSTLPYVTDHGLIYFDRKKELDELYKEELPQYYGSKIIIPGRYEDPVIDDFYLTYRAMLLTKIIAEQEEKDLSKVDYSPIVKKLYKYAGKM